MFLYFAGAILSALALVFCHNKMGPYTLEIEELANCNKDDIAKTGDDFLVIGNVHHLPGAQNVFWTGNLTFKNGFGQRGATRLESHISKWDPVSGWRKGWNVHRWGEICYLFDLVLPVAPDTYKKYAQAHIPNLPPFNKPCPLPKVLHFNNMSLQYGTISVLPVATYGRFLCIAKFFDMKKHEQKTPRACTRTVIRFSEKL